MREKHWDILRGYAILLVVLGHAIQSTFPDNCDDYLLFELIYSFHMPLMMYISGRVSFKKDRMIDMKWLLSRARVLLFPFIIWTLIGSVIAHGSRLSLESIVTDIIYLNGPWFLWVLFVNDVLLMFCSVVSRKVPQISFAVIMLISSCIVWGCSLSIGMQPVIGLNVIPWHYVYFMLGFLISMYYGRLKRYVSYMSYALSFFFVFFVRFYRRTEAPLFTPTLLPFVKNQFLIQIISSSFRLLIAFSGIALSSVVVSYLGKYIKFSFFSMLGRSSLTIYLVHLYVFRIVPQINFSFLRIIILSLVGVLASFGIDRLIDDSYLGVILFGKKSKCR